MKSEDLLAALNELRDFTNKKKLPRKKMSVEQELIKELRNFKGLKKSEPNEPKNFVTKETLNFKKHAFIVKSTVDYAIISKIKQRMLNDENYVNFLRDIRNYEFVNKTPFLPKREKLPFLDDIKKGVKLDSLYTEGFYILKFF